MSDFILKASVRNDLGKGASRRLRRANQQVPAVIYGGEKGAQSISVEKTAFYKAIEDESFFSSVIKLVIDGAEEQVVVRDLQRHPFKPLLTHADFLRVDATHEITINVPLHVVGEEKCVGIKDQGGELHVLANEVAISCLPKDLPDFLEVDISAIELGTTLHLSDLNLPAGVTSVDLAHGEDHDNAVLSITKVKVRGGDDEESNDEEEPSAE
ncbi:50S ribosomal protein L25/general stress protein Ctc [Vreelandella venusta]|uniref:Large ribosomal subunit protein bL25 n=1 Tax=Vreelandella venusta TaxID=44935 RepID=A0AAP9ZFK9_9GAMM|nr:50S ribosomal protein L25/general stress protein Ctc [Halomonas venusta]MBR9926320.1 50S ribosomal protein L25/general stress protein Ctc [Gammaproteobacteria bacterium]AZM95305.1 50S ribosomal protein L25/general stress protein Ctc [Halomonas venusta]MDW0360626.1 50S ribosomal protein L25/general stress protein Ctc [Halomonas venusta]MDX1713387.1 50S ribosomal protein L25/general stress protein Ctc [Halomonas venusta]NPT29822.1 50S ribosomal protein L25 [Halomonas venusta]